MSSEASLTGDHHRRNADRAEGSAVKSASLLIRLRNPRPRRSVDNEQLCSRSQELPSRDEINVGLFSCAVKHDSHLWFLLLAAIQSNQNLCAFYLLLPFRISWLHVEDYGKAFVEPFGWLGFYRYCSCICPTEAMFYTIHQEVFSSLWCFQTT